MPRGRPWPGPAPTTCRPGTSGTSRWARRRWPRPSPSWASRPTIPWSSTARRARTGPGCWPPWCSTCWAWTPEVIVADYVITADRMELILGRYRSDPAFAARMATVPASRFGVEATTMEGFLDLLHQRFGGAEGWATASGVPAGIAGPDEGPAPRTAGVNGPAATGPAGTPARPGSLYTGPRERLDLDASAGRDRVVPRPDAGGPGRHRLLGLEVGAAQVAGVPLPRRGDRGDGAVGGRRRPPAARRRACLPDEVGRWAPRRVRKEMWHSVDQAEAAVRAAGELGAPTAELPSLCRRLQAAAVDLDKVLRVEPAGPVPMEIRTQVHRGDAGRRGRATGRGGLGQ